MSKITIVDRRGNTKVIVVPGARFGLSNDPPAALGPTALPGTAVSGQRAGHVHPTTGLALAVDLAELEVDLGEEVTRATAAEGTEATARAAADATLQANIDELDSDLGEETTRATAAEGANATAISAETTRATAAEAAVASDLAELETDLGEETTRATAAEAANSAAVTTETARATAAEAAGLLATVPSAMLQLAGGSPTLWDDFDRPNGELSAANPPLVDRARSGHWYTAISNKRLRSVIHNRRFVRNVLSDGSGATSGGNGGAFLYARMSAPPAEVVGEFVLTPTVTNVDNDTAPYTPTTTSQNAVVGAAGSAFSESSVQLAVYDDHWKIFYTVTPVNQGVWSGATAYNLNDGVSYGGLYWVCVNPDAVTGVVPGTDASRWAPLNSIPAGAVQTVDLVTGNFSTALPIDGTTRHRSAIRRDPGTSTARAIVDGQVLGSYTGGLVNAYWGSVAGWQIRHDLATDGDVQFTAIAASNPSEIGRRTQPAKGVLAYLPGGSGPTCFATRVPSWWTPNDLDIRFLIGPDLYSQTQYVGSIYDSADNQRMLKVQVSAGKVVFFLSHNGTADVEHDSSILVPGLASGVVGPYGRILYNASTGGITYQTSTDRATWATYDTGSVSAGAPFKPTLPIQIRAGATDSLTLGLQGLLGLFEIRDGTDGPLVANFDPTGSWNGYDSAGNWWTPLGPSWSWAVAPSSIVGPTPMTGANNLSEVTDAALSRSHIGVETLGSAKAVAVTTQTPLSGLPTIDGYACTDGDVVMLVAQGTASQNGPWVVHSGAWTRPTDYSTGLSLFARNVLITGGSVFAGTRWATGSTSAMVVGTDSTSWFRIDGLTITKIIAASSTAQTLDFKAYDAFDVTLTGNCTFTYSNIPASPQSPAKVLILRQDGTGSRTVTLPAGHVWPNGVAYVASTAASAVDRVAVVVDPVTAAYAGMFQKAFA